VDADKHRWLGFTWAQQSCRFHSSKERYHQGKKIEIREEIQEEQDISERKGGQQFTDSSQWLITKGRTGEELKVIKISSL
jgi:hypothetical protein